MAMKSLCLLLCLAAADGATLSATKLSLSDRSRAEEAPLPPTFQEASPASLAETAAAFHDLSDIQKDDKPHLDLSVNFVIDAPEAAELKHSSGHWDDYELDQHTRYSLLQHLPSHKGGKTREPQPSSTRHSLLEGNSEKQKEESSAAPSENPAETAIVKAKVKEVRALIESHKKEYNDPKTSEARKDELFMETLGLSRKHMGSPGYNYEECLDLWQNTDQESMRKTFYDCPALSFPDARKFQKNIREIQDSAPSALRSAYLSEFFWTAMLKNDISMVKSMLAPDVTMYEENQVVASGQDQVAMKAPHIGYPSNADTAAPEEWTCDALGCIVPVKSWQEKACPVMAKFDVEGKVNMLTANLYCWR